MGDTTLGRERASNPFLHDSSRVERRFQAPRGTYDVLPEDALARDAVERAGGASSSARATAHRDAAFEATELFARGVGADRHRPEGDVHVPGRRRAVVTLRPEGTAPVVGSYLEHGMHKLPQPVKLWYLSSFFRYERAAGRPLPPVLAGRRGGDRVTRPGRRRGVDPPAARAAAPELGVRGLRLRLSSPAPPETRARYRERLQDHLRAHEEQLSGEVRGRIELNPLRAFDSDSNTMSSSRKSSHRHRRKAMNSGGPGPSLGEMTRSSAPIPETASTGIRRNRVKNL